MAFFTFADNSVVKMVDIGTNKNIAGGFAGDPTTEFLIEVLQPNEPDDTTITLFQFIKSEQDPYFYIMTASGQFLYVITDALNPDVHKVTWAPVNPLGDEVIDKTGFLFSAAQVPNGNPNQPLYYLYSAVIGEGNLHLFGSDLLMAVPPNPADPDQIQIQIEIVGKGQKVKGHSDPLVIGSGSNTKLPIWVWVVLAIALVLFIVLLIFIFRNLYLRGLSTTRVATSTVLSAPSPLSSQITSWTPPPPRAYTYQPAPVQIQMPGQPPTTWQPPAQTTMFQDTRPPVATLQSRPQLVAPQQPVVLLGTPAVAPVLQPVAQGPATVSATATLEEVPPPPPPVGNLDDAYLPPQDLGPTVPDAPPMGTTRLPNGGYVYNSGGRQYYVAPRYPQQQRSGGVATNQKMHNTGFPYMVPSSQGNSTNNNNRFNKPNQHNQSATPSLPWTHTLAPRGKNPYAMRGGSLSFQ